MTDRVIQELMQEYEQARQQKLADFYSKLASKR